jgi:hypothetical protein
MPVLLQRAIENICAENKSLLGKFWMRQGVNFCRPRRAMTCTCKRKVRADVWSSSEFPRKSLTIFKLKRHRDKVDLWFVVFSTMSSLHTLAIKSA